MCLENVEFFVPCYLISDHFARKRHDYSTLNEKNELQKKLNDEHKMLQ